MKLLLSKKLYNSLPLLSKNKANCRVGYKTFTKIYIKEDKKNEKTYSKTT